MRDNWINADGHWLNLDAIRDICVVQSKGRYRISYSCNPYGRDLTYETLDPLFDSREEAQEYLDKLLQGETDE